MKYENYDIRFPDQPVVDLYLPIWASLPEFRDKPAFIWVDDGPARSSGPSALTYGQLNSSVQAISTQLLVSLQKGDTVVILSAPGMELVKIIFAFQRAGLLAVPISPPHPSFSDDNYHHLVRVLSQTKPKAALAARSYVDRVRDYYTSSGRHKRLSDLLQKVRWIATEDLTGLKPDVGVQCSLSPYDGCRANEVFLIQYTSGGTEIPKPVLVTSGAAAHNVRVVRKTFDQNPNSVFVSWLPQYHDCGLMILLITIVSGATCVLTSPNAFIKRPRLWLELITEFKATCTAVPSFTLPLVIRRGGVEKGTHPINLATMKNVMLINEPIYKASIEEFVQVFGPFGLNPTCISPTYGLAEICSFVSTSWRSESDGNFPIHKNLLPSAKLPSSREEILEEEIEILVVNEETHEPLEDGIEGAIWISSASNAFGYLDHSFLTQEIFYARLRNKVSGCGFVRTGDRGIVLGKERYLYVTGRFSDIINCANGEEMHPHYIETAAYNSCPGILRAGCLAAFEVSGNVVIVAELRKERIEHNDLVKICEGIRNGIMNEEKVEVGLVVLVKIGSVPKTTSGKIQRWVAKYKLERGQMNVVMKMDHFSSDGYNSTLLTEIPNENKGKDEIFLANSKTKKYLSLVSCL